MAPPLNVTQTNINRAEIGVQAETVGCGGTTAKKDGPGLTRAIAFEHFNFAYRPSASM
jgi:hypothetical protein